MVNPLFAAFLIFRSEILQQLRDRHALLYAVILPLGLYPFLIFGLLQIASLSEGIRSRSDSRILLIEPEPILESVLSGIESIRTLAPKDLEGPLRSFQSCLDRDLVDAIVAARQVGGRISVWITYDGTKDRSQSAMDRLTQRLEEYRGELVAQGLSSLGLSWTDLCDVAVEEKSTASPEKMGRFALSLLLPGMLLLMATMGASHPAIDVTVGERERSTIETSLLLPAPRWALVAGKFASVVAFALAAVLLNLTSMSLSIQHLVSGLKVESWDVILRPGQLLLLFLVAGLYAMWVGSVLVLIASRATHLGEAQSLVAPLYMLSVLPGAVASLPWMTLSSRTALIPLLNAVLCFKAILSGNLPPGPFLIALASLGVLALAFMAIAITFTHRGGERL